MLPQHYGITAAAAEALCPLGHPLLPPHLCFVVLEQLWPLEAELGCDEVVLNAEGVGVKVDGLGELKALQPRLLAWQRGSHTV